MVRTTAGCLLIAASLGASAVALAQAPQVASANRANHLPNKGRVILPMAFEANRGQAPAGVDFLAMGQGYGAQVRADSIVLNFPPASSGKTGAAKLPAQTVVRIELSGANRAAKGQGEDKSRAYTNYLFGSDPAKWITHVDQYGRVRYASVYPGIDVLLHGNENRLEQDFVIHPAADPKQIRLKFNGVRDVRVSGDGDLVLRAADRSLRLQKPRAYEMVNGAKVEVVVNYEVQGRAVGFRLCSYDPQQELVIDPVLVFSTFFGGAITPGSGALYQFVSQIVADASGVYAVGYTNSVSFPVTSGAIQPTFPGAPAGLGAVFVSKLDPAGQLVFSTYLAGFQPPTQSGPPPLQTTIPNVGLAVDGSGNVYVGGNTGSGLPIPSGSQAFQSALNGLENVGIIKLSSTGTAVLTGTYLGGSKTDYIWGLAVDSSGDVYVSGATMSPDFPLKNPLQSALGTGGSSGFATELNPTLSALVYSTYFRANSQVNIYNFDVSRFATNSLAIDSSGDAYILGQGGAGFPTTPGAYQSTCVNGVCNFVIEMGAGGSAILYSTYTGAFSWGDKPALFSGCESDSVLQHDWKHNK